MKRYTITNLLVILTVVAIPFHSDRWNEETGVLLYDVDEHGLTERGRLDSLALYEGLTCDENLTD